MHDRCGYHHSLYDDDGLAFTPTDAFCPGCAALDLTERVRREEEHSSKRPPDKPHPGDGRTTYLAVSVLPPDPAVATAADGQHDTHGNDAEKR